MKYRVGTIGAAMAMALTLLATACGTAPPPGPAEGAPYPPAITGTARVGQVLTASAHPATPASASTTLAWERCLADGSACTPTGITGSNGLVLQSDLGRRLVAVATTVDGASVTVSRSASTAVVDATPVTIGDPPADEAVLLPESGGSGGFQTASGGRVVTLGSSCFTSRSEYLGPFADNIRLHYGAYAHVKLWAELNSSADAARLLGYTVWFTEVGGKTLSPGWPEYNQDWTNRKPTGTGSGTAIVAGDGPNLRAAVVGDGNWSMWEFPLNIYDKSNLRLRGGVSWDSGNVAEGQPYPLPNGLWVNRGGQLRAEMSPDFRDWGWSNALPDPSCTATVPTNWPIPQPPMNPDSVQLPPRLGNYNNVTQVGTINGCTFEFTTFEFIYSFAKIRPIWGCNREPERALRIQVRTTAGLGQSCNGWDASENQCEFLVLDGAFWVQSRAEGFLLGARVSMNGSQWYDV